MEARSRNHFCCGKAVSVTYFGGVFVALGIPHAMRMRHVYICGLAGLFDHFASQAAQFSEKNLLNIKMCFDFLFSVCLKHFSF
jgi:hypothetical protein